uniref:Photosystem II Psb31 protein domain-containing protein n=1 Tax=Odontella aurita TaxID=265563 RepID=A0A7S4JTL7_9STRA|mmetsp:Transcript_53886/g.161228  ORF Transcript_53886/g.161228 Transcript_53886/m.161228 type:complete len:281 (+) Transcript_53886:213-1055(+)
MKLSIALSAACAVNSASAFVAPFTARTSTITSTAVSANSLDGGDAGRSLDRRALLQSLGTMAAVALPQVASAGLLDEYGSDPKKINDSKKEAAAPEAAVGKKKDDSTIEPNLRSNYYYPTNKKRYLPRIKRCNDAIPSAAAMIGEGDWDGATDFAVRIADDTILPMKLYTSSLLGGGTNVKVSFAKDMTDAAKDFEKAQKKLLKSLAKKDQTASSRALEDLSVALQTYRTAGRLTGPDGGGDIPSVDEIRRAACRVQGRSFEQKVKARDLRLSEATSRGS